MMKFDLPKDQSSIIKVIGVGGGGSNAVNHMYNQGIRGVDFLVCNTDQQALDISPVPVKIQLGASLTEGRGAGSLPEVGKNAAIENIDEIKEILGKNTKMVFVTAGMGGGTGTGAAPIIAKVAKEMGILTVGIVTVPFNFEGRKRRDQAENGLEQMREAVDTLLVINNDRLREMYGNLTLANAFAQADDVLTIAAKGIAEVISVTGAINVDFNDVNTVMKDSGVAIMGSASADGEDRAIKAVEQALSSPLLNDNDIAGATYVLLNISYGSQEVLMDEISDITDYIQDEAGSTADVIWGHCYDESLGDSLGVTIIATGFKTSPDTGFESSKEPVKKKVSLDEDRPTMITKPIESPIESPTKQTENKNWETTSNEEKSEDVENWNVPEPYLKKDDEDIENVEDDHQQTSMNFEGRSGSFSENLSSDYESEGKVSDDGKVRYSLDTEWDFPENETSNTPEMESNDDAANNWSDPNAAINTESPLSAEEQQKMANDRIDRIKNLSMKLKSPSGITDLENEPAYKRRQIKLDAESSSDEENVSRYTLGEEDVDGEKKTQLRPNNPFLHDNVD